MTTAMCWHAYGFPIVKSYIVPPLRHVPTYAECTRLCVKCRKRKIIWTIGTPGDAMKDEFTGESYVPLWARIGAEQLNKQK